MNVDGWFQVLVFSACSPKTLNSWRLICRTCREVLQRDDLWKVIFGSVWTRRVLSHWVAHNAWIWSDDDRGQISVDTLDEVVPAEFKPSLQGWQTEYKRNGFLQRDYVFRYGPAKDRECRIEAQDLPKPLFTPQSSKGGDRNAPCPFDLLQQVALYVFTQDTGRHVLLQTISILHIWRLVHQDPLHSSSHRFIISFPDVMMGDGDHIWLEIWLMNNQTKSKRVLLQISLAWQLHSSDERPTLCYRVLDPQALCISYGDQQFPFPRFCVSSSSPNHFHSWMELSNFNLIDFHQPDARCSFHDTTRHNQLTEETVSFDPGCLIKNLNSLLGISSLSEEMMLENKQQVKFFLLTAPFQTIKPLVLGVRYITMQRAGHMGLFLFRMGPTSPDLIWKQIHWLVTGISSDSYPVLPLWLNERQLVIQIFRLKTHHHVRQPWKSIVVTLLSSQ